MKILITGGHITPALAFIDHVQSTSPKTGFVFVGREYSQDKIKQKSIEKQEIKKRKIKFIEFRAVRMVSGGFLYKITLLPALIKSISKASTILKKEKPDVLLSFGGYVAVPFAVACWLKRIPVITHEQTRAGGLANIIISKFARKVAVSFPDSLEHFPHKKVVFTGNPLRAGLLKSKQKKPSWFKSTSKKPVLLIMGGNQGSKVINNIVSIALPQLVSKFVIVHQCGKPTVNDNYKKDLLRKKAFLDKKLQSSYYVREWISEEDLFWLFGKVSLVVSRSGANTVTELAVAQVPSVQIPLPFAYNQEQKKNAEWLVEADGAVLLEQSKLDSESLLKSIKIIMRRKNKMSKNLASLKVNVDASEKLFCLVQSNCHESK